MTCCQWPTSLLVFLVLLPNRGSVSVLLHRLEVPRVIRNGTLASAVLDCHYTLNHSEKDSMVLKWYKDGNAIYQWIPPARPQGLGALRGKIDLDFVRSPAPLSRHRALHLLSPTTEMSGDYMCKVSTMQNEVSASSKMVVFEPPRSVDFFHRKSVGSLFNMTCLVDHAYPEPTVSILYDRGGGDRIRLEGVEVRSGQYPDGAWRKVVFAVLSEATLIEDTSFHCDVRLPDTHFLDGKTIFYFPGDPTVMASASGATVAQLGYHKEFIHWIAVFYTWREFISL